MIKFLNHILCLLFILISFTSNVLSNPIDSLISLYNKSKAEDKALLLNKIADEFVNNDYDTSLIPSDHIFRFENLEHAQKADLYLFIGISYYNKQKYPKSYLYLKESLKIYKSDQNIIGEAKANNKLGLVSIKLYDYEVAISYLMDAISVFQNNNESEFQADALINVANVYFELEFYNDAKSFYTEALKIWEQLGDTLKISESYYYLARVAVKSGIDDEAFKLNEKSIELKEKIKFPEGIVLSYFLMAEIFERKMDYSKAESYYVKSLQLAKEFDNRFSEAKTLSALGNLFLLTGDVKKARDYLNVAMNAAEFINFKEVLIEVYKNLSTLYETENVNDKALFFYKKYTDVKEGLFADRQYQKTALLKLNLENQAKSKTIQDLEIETIYKDQLLDKQTNFIIASILAVLLFLSLVIFIFRQSQGRKKINKELKKQKDKAEEADRLKSAFLANMSHEIRSPMNAIIGFSNLVTDSFELNDEIVKYMGYIKISGSNLLQLVDDIIDIAKIEAGQLKIRMEKFDLDLMLNRLFISVQAGLAKDKNTGAKITLKLPANSEKPVILSDELRIKQVLTNFLSNAIKFTDKGVIEFGYEKLPDSQLLFYTQDTGLGIPEKDKDLIFQRFGQVEDTYTRNTSGTGLGLAISKSIIELLNGEIWVESIENKGSTFYFKIPVEYLGKRIESHEIQIQAPLSFNWSDKTIMIVEDDDMNYNVLEVILQKTNVNIIRAINGHDAIEMAFANQKINLILLDIQLPVINGYQVCTKIKAKRQIPIIAVTAYAMPGEREKCLNSGCDDFITKPYNMEDLLNRIFNLIDS